MHGRSWIRLALGIHIFLSHVRVVRTVLVSVRNMEYSYIVVEVRVVVLMYHQILIQRNVPIFVRRIDISITISVCKATHLYLLLCCRFSLLQGQVQAARYTS